LSSTTEPGALALSRHTVRTPEGGHASRPRLEVLDSARVLATLGVIWTHVVEVQGHSPRIAALGRFGTSYYILAAVLFAYRGRTQSVPAGFGEELRTRGRRLIVPFLSWGVLYGVLYYRYGVSVGMNLTEIAEWWGPLAGTARHLWFLPFAYFVATLTSFSTGYLRRLETPVLATLVGLGVPFVYWALECHVFFWLDRDWAVKVHLHRVDRWIEEAPLAISAMLSFPLVDRLASSARQTRAISREWFAIPLVVGLGLVQWAYYCAVEPLRPITGGESRFFAHAVGCLLLGATLLLRNAPGVRRFSRLGRHTYFIFLGHVVVLDAVNALLQGVPGFGTLGLSTLVAVGIFCLGLLLGPVFARVPVLKLLYPR
jgi:hypothetical protein